jgi:hypothetical protein
MMRALCFGLAVLVVLSCCACLMAESPRRDINVVLAAHDKELLAIPGVTGVYVGVLADGKTPCLKIMLSKRTETLERSLPRQIEGYPVITEVTGEIRPFSQ